MLTWCEHCDDLPVEQLQIIYSLGRRELLDDFPARLAQRGLIALLEVVHVGHIFLLLWLRLCEFLLGVAHHIHGLFDVLASEVRYLHFFQGSGAQLAFACEVPA